MLSFSGTSTCGPLQHWPLPLAFTAIPGSFHVALTARNGSEGGGALVLVFEAFSREQRRSCQEWRQREEPIKWHVEAPAKHSVLSLSGNATALCLLLNISSVLLLTPGHLYCRVSSEQFLESKRLLFDGGKVRRQAFESHSTLSQGTGPNWTNSQCSVLFVFLWGPWPWHIS